MAWAESGLRPTVQGEGKTADNLLWIARDSHNLASIEMLRLTGDEVKHDLFMENSVLKTDNPDLFIWE